MNNNTKAPFSVMAHLSSWLLRPKLGDSKPPTLWPSSPSAVDSNGKFHGTCRRQTFLQYVTQLVPYSDKLDGKYSYWKGLIDEVKKVYVSPSKYQMWLFDSAERYERHVIDHAKESGIYLGDQIIVYLPKTNVSGKIDLITKNLDNGLKIINEVKSVYSFGADEVLGKNFDRHQFFTGQPRTTNLMQVALYQFHYADETFDNARLIYGDRGTGKYAEYEVQVHKESGAIRYRCIDPMIVPWTTVPYTILDIMNVYENILLSVDSGDLPARDYDAKYSLETLTKKVNEQYNIIELDKEDEKIATHSSIDDFLNAANGQKGRKFKVEEVGAGTLTRIDAEQHIKHLDRIVNGGRAVKPADSGSFNCRVCSNRNFCYNEDKTPRRD